MKRVVMYIAAAFLLLSAIVAGESFAIEIGDLFVITPPPIEMKGQPELVPIPGRYAYFVADIDEDLFFYQGKWYRPYNKRWFRATSYNGPWETVRDIPPALRDLPSDYRNTSRGSDRVPYAELRDNWERWEKEKYWDRRRDEGKERPGAGMAPAPIRFAGTPEFLPVPGRYVYFISDTDADIFFYRGRWFRFYKGHWLRSSSYNGTWEPIRRVPPAIKDVPLDYRSIPPGLDRIPYGELRDNWEKWEQDKYWDKKRDEGRGSYRDRGDERDEDMDRYPEERQRERY